MVVWDLGDRASDEQVYEIYDAFWDFAAFTGDETLCVPGVRIGGERGALARYWGPGRWLRIRGDMVGRGYRFATHEMCHAWDHEHGHPSAEVPEIFTGEEIALDYGNEVARRKESFAQTCEHGPQDVALMQGVDEICGTHRTDERQRWVMEEVYTQWQPPFDVLGTTDIALERVSLPAYPALWSWVSAGGELIALALMGPAIDGDALAPPLAPPRYPSGYGERLGCVLLRVDPWSGEEIERVRLPLVGTECRHLHLIGGDRDPLVVLAAEHETMAWRLRQGDNRLEQVPFPALGWAGAPDAGVLRGDRAWMTLELEDRDGYFFEVDLTTGEADELRLDDGSDEGQAIYPVFVQDLSEQLFIYGILGNEARVLTLDPESRRGVSLDLECGGTLEAIVQLDEDRFLASISVRADNDELLMVLALMDMQEGGWRISPDSCESEWYSGRPDLRSARRFMMIDGQPWSIEDRPTADGTEQRYLTRVTVPSP